MAANARPLWSLLPDGALKRQLLGDIAQAGHLEAAELSNLWSTAPPGAGGGTRDRYKNESSTSKRDAGYRPISPPSRGARTLPGRPAPTSRADHVARLLLSDAAAWDNLSHEMHNLLCELPAPHGPLFAWLDSQVHEHGPLPWGSLSPALQDHPSGPLAHKLMAEVQALGPQGAESAAELRDLLGRMLIERLKTQETEAIEAAATDPQALQRYRELHAQRLALEASLVPGSLAGA